MVTPTQPPATTPTPTAPPTPTAAPTKAAGACPPSYPPEPASFTEGFPSAGGNIALPSFADQTGTVNLPSNNAASGETITFQESQTPFTDAGGGGNIPAPPSGQTAVSYVASFVSPAQTLNFNSSDIVITASAPCEILAGHTYVAYAYANGGGFTHSELSPTTGYTTTMGTTSSGAVSVTFTIDLSNDLNMQPNGVGLETVFADTNTTQ